jgi:hypothetical protein
MKLPRRHFLHLMAGATALPALSRIASAQAYPTRPVIDVRKFAHDRSAHSPCRPGKRRNGLCRSGNVRSVKR